LAELQTSEPGRPLYETPMGALFDKEWRKGAKAVKRREMRELPFGLRLDMEDEAADKTLDLADWEKDIIFTSM